MNRNFLFSAILLGMAMLLPPAFHGQDQAQNAGKAETDNPTEAPHLKIVNIPAIVRDKHGRIVTDLSKDDFLLQEDGRFQDIRYFSKENNQPLVLGLLLDTSMSQRRVLGHQRDSSSSFIDQILHPDRDQAFVIHFDREIELDQDVTSSREKLHKALESVETPQFSQSGGSPQDRDQDNPGRRGSYGHGGAMLYDAIYLASDEILKKQKGHKAIVVLSDGVDRGSKETLRGAIEAAQRADVTVYTVLFNDEQPAFGGDRGGFGGPWGGHRGGMGGHRYPQEPRPDGKKILEQISRETGGKLFEFSGKEPVDKISRQIQEQLRGQYSLGYMPDRVVPAEGFHKIEVKVRKKDFTVQARAGYYAEELR